MASLLTNKTTNGAGSGVSHSGPCSVFVTGVFDGCEVVIEASTDDSVYVKADNIAAVSRFSAGGVIQVDIQGAYYLRATVSNAGGSTSITVVTTS